MVRFVLLGLSSNIFLYIDDINLGGGGFQNGQRTVNFVFYTEFLISRFEACLFEVQKALQMPANSNKK